MALEIEKQLAAEAKKRQRVHGQTAPGRAKTLVSTLTQVSDSGSARDKAAEMIGANPHYVTDAKKIEREAAQVLDQAKY